MGNFTAICMSHRSSTNDRRNPYQVPGKVNRFWHDHVPGRLFCYSQETKDELDGLVEQFKEFKGEWNKKKK